MFVKRRSDGTFIEAGTGKFVKYAGEEFTNIPSVFLSGGLSEAKKLKKIDLSLEIRDGCNVILERFGLKFDCENGNNIWKIFFKRDEKLKKPMLAPSHINAEYNLFLPDSGDYISRNHGVLEIIYKSGLENVNFCYIDTHNDRHGPTYYLYNRRKPANALNFNQKQNLKAGDSLVFSKRIGSVMPEDVLYEIVIGYLLE